MKSIKKIQLFIMMLLPVALMLLSTLSIFPVNQGDDFFIRHSTKISSDDPEQPVTPIPPITPAPPVVPPPPPPVPPVVH